ncbi:MAG: hypothetical protein NT169_09185 [Chloroflexi bacterium]|nr:hypothetical protein [Chloroflexota bacterium]
MAAQTYSGDEETRLDSFVLRFVHDVRAAAADGPPRLAPPWHGLIRHVQSNRERTFTRWPDALAFIGEFVVLREELTHD